MPLDSQNSREIGYYFSLAQVGLEMVAPLGIGLYVDYLLASSPWGLIIGTIVGFVGGIFHLVSLANKQDAVKSAGRGDGDVNRPAEDKRP